MTERKGISSMVRGIDLCEEDGGEGSETGDGHRAADGACGAGERSDW